jgi:hypothetical protein
LIVAIPHRSTQNDIFEGQFIPAGTIVIPNIWYTIIISITRLYSLSLNRAISQDPTIYPSPEIFDPVRFMPFEIQPKEREGIVATDPQTYAFGYGRRICPGRHLGSSSAWFAMASILATFSIGKQKDINGMEITPKAEFGGDGAVRYSIVDH